MVLSREQATAALKGLLTQALGYPDTHHIFSCLKEEGINTILDLMITSEGEFDKLKYRSGSVIRDLPSKDKRSLRHLAMWARHLHTKFGNIDWEYLYP